jgi:hypothetical protein
MGDEFKPHRDSTKSYIDYYVNGKLEFSVWKDEKLQTEEEVVSRLLEDKDWKFMMWYCGWTLKKDKTVVSSDLSRVDLFVTEKKQIKS